MRRFSRSLVVMALGCLLTAGCAGRQTGDAEKPFIGTWFSQGGNGDSRSWRLESNGTFGEARGYQAPQPDDGEWEVVGDELVLTVKQPDGKKAEQRAKVKVVGDTMTVQRGQSTSVFTRTK